jgi:hypothetical protein
VNHLQQFFVLNRLAELHVYHLLEESCYELQQIIVVEVAESAKFHTKIIQKNSVSNLSNRESVNVVY